MRFRDRTLHLAMAFLLPVVCLASMLAFTIASVRFGESDRAIIWAEGSETQLLQLSRRVADTAQFPDGRYAGPTTSLQRPDGCGPEAREFSIGSLRVEEAQAARVLLESLASESGARVCLTNVFVLNELPRLEPGRKLSYVVAGFLRSLLLPCGIALAVFFMFSGQFGLRFSRQDALSRRAVFGLAGATALATWLVPPLLGMLARGLGFEVPRTAGLAIPEIGASLAFALVIASPFMDELAFRGWMLPLAERATGLLPGAMLSTATYAALQEPSTALDAAIHVVQGGLYAALFLRTRSLPACVLAHCGCSVATLLIGGL